MNSPLSPPPDPSVAPGVLRALAVVVALLLGGGVVAALAVSAGDDRDEAPLGAPPPSAPMMTTTTTAPPPEETTITTEAPATTATTATTSTTTAPATTTTVQRETTTTAARASCGTGRATTEFSARQPATSEDQTSFVPEAAVTNGVDRSIVVTELAYDVRFDEGVVRRVTFATGGTVLRPGATARFTADRVSGPGQPRSAELVRFTYHTEGQPNACRVTL